jgi:hypothetical protein
VTSNFAPGDRKATQATAWPDQTLHLEVLGHNHVAGRVLNHRLRSLTEQLCERKLEFGEIDFLKSSQVYHIMQFFYFFRAYRIETEEQITRYVKLHDADLSRAQETFTDLAKSAEDAWLEKKKKLQTRPTDRDSVETKARRDKKHRLVPRPTRFESAFIGSPYRIKQIAKNLNDGRVKGVLRFALSDLQRLMIEVMVAESCSTTCWELHKLKLLKYARSGPAVIIDSPGHLEACFRDHLAFLVEAIRPLFQQSK